MFSEFRISPCGSQMRTTLDGVNPDSLRLSFRTLSNLPDTGVPDSNKDSSYRKTGWYYFDGGKWIEEKDDKILEIDGPQKMNNAR